MFNRKIIWKNNKNEKIKCCANCYDKYSKFNCSFINNFTSSIKENVNMQNQELKYDEIPRIVEERL